MTFSAVIKDQPDENNKSNNIWADLLSEVRGQSCQRLPSGKSILILGDESVGKSNLISKLKKESDISKGYALEYQSLEVKDEEREEYARLGIWIGDSRCYNPMYTNKNGQNQSVLSSLLNNALSSKNISDTLLVIVLSMSEPWFLIENLKKWLDCVENHIINKILKPKMFKDLASTDKENINQLSPQKYDRLKSLVVKNFLSYNEIEGSKINTNNLFSDANEDLSPEQMSLLLQDENILVNNLGIPVLVVVSKTDVMNELTKDFEYRNEHYDFIQQHLRKMCLKYGAGLIYTSCKENKNCDLLRQYILHLIYSFPFKRGPKIIDNDSIFIPLGWDSSKKIAILNEGLLNISSDSNFEEVITSPLQTKTKTNKATEIVAEEEQLFLARMHGVLTQAHKNRKEIIATGSSLQLTTPSRSDLNLSASPSTVLVGTGNMISSNTLLTGAINISSSSSAAAAANINILGAGTNTLSNNPLPENSSERVLTSFFNNLLNKKSSITASSFNNTNNSNNSSINLTVNTTPKIARQLIRDNLIKGEEDNLDNSNLNQLNVSNTLLHTNSITSSNTFNQTSDSDLIGDTLDNDMSLTEMSEHLDRVSCSTPKK